MCGIVGVITKPNAENFKVIDFIIAGLKLLEYRGYDSAGLVLLESSADSSLNFSCFKELGKIANLEKSLVNRSSMANIGIGHTRWATHGKPSKENAHPHYNQEVAVVHNGIIENYQKIKQNLVSHGVVFNSSTDSEVVPHLVSYHLEKSQNYQQAINSAISELQGTFALAIIFRHEPSKIYLVKQGSPLVIGIGDNKNFIASDYQAIANYTKNIIDLEDGQLAIVESNKVEIFDFANKKIDHQVRSVANFDNISDKGEFPHYMLKEICEQPRVIQETLEAYIDLDNFAINLPKFSFDLCDIKKINIIACGTSYYAGMVAKHIIENIARVDVAVDVASEYRYNNPIIANNSLNIFISQSGETADTLASLKYCQNYSNKTLAIVNRQISAMSNVADYYINTKAGPEIGVASTKCYIAQIVVLSLLAIDIALTRQNINIPESKTLIKQIINSQDKILQILTKKNTKILQEIALQLKDATNILYIGRGISSITALEASLKMRELSYINAYGLAAGELKHGTIALISDGFPVVATIVYNKENHIHQKTISNIEEVLARGAKVFVIADIKAEPFVRHLTDNIFVLPAIEGIIEEALVPVVANQLLAYFTSLALENDVDKPRNLAKSVTVE